MSGSFGNASVLSYIDLGTGETHTYRITMTAGVTYTFDEHYRKWAMTSGEWFSKEHFYLPDEFRISLYTKNSAGRLVPVSDFQNQPEHGWQGTYGDPDFQTFPFDMAYLVGNREYFAFVRQVAVILAGADFFPPGQQYRTMCELAVAEGLVNGERCGTGLDIAKDDGRLLRTASYTPTESGVYYLQVTRVYDDAPVWGPDIEGSAYIAPCIGNCVPDWGLQELEEAWYIPVAGYDTAGDDTIVDENDDRTYMLMYNGHHYPNRKAFPYYELSVEVTVPEQGSPQQAVNIPAVNTPAANTPATGGPGIDGSLRAGETLTASTSGIADEDGMSGAVFSYQWIRHDLATATDTDIESATGSTYPVTTADEGKGLKVRVTFTDDAGNEESLTSYAVIVSRPLVVPDEEVANTPATGAPGIDGSPVVGQSLTATTSDIGDADGLTNATFSYQWLAADAAIEGATASTYTVAAGDVGKALKVRVTFTDDAGHEESVTSAATAAVQQPLTADIHDAPESHDGSASFTFELRFSETPREDFSYVTLRDHAYAVTGGTVANVRRLEPGKNVRWEITVQPSGDADVTLSLPVTTDCASLGAVCTGDGRMLSAEVELTVSGPGSQQSSQENSAATGAPTISGTAQVGNTLTVSTSGIADADGLSSATFSYQWVAGESDISGATGSSYTLTSSEQGKTIKVRVTFTDDAGNGESLTSAATATVAAAPSPLTATAHSAPASHDGSNSFTFELRFSETPREDFSYVTLRDHAFTVTGGEVVNARRLEQGKNVRWEITVQPSGNADLTIVLPVTTDCDAQGAVCTGDGRKLSQRVELTVSGPSG